ISGSKSSRGAALFNKPTSSSNSVANTEEGNLIDGLVLGTQSVLTLCWQNTSDCGSKGS
uniref:Uncharacterized protein n=1 Tax=Athene cunicularia TaxID=194338 RepID=A0A663M9B0_ATHCN